MASKPLHIKKAVVKKPREKSVVLKEGTKVKKVADAILDGKRPVDIAKELGISRHQVNNALNAPTVRSYMGHNQKQLQEALNIHRGDIVIALLETADEAKLAADHGTMVRAYTEVAKMLGLYAPEVKQINITTGQQAMISKYEQMSDAELLQIAEGRVIDGESTRVQ